MVAKSKTTVEFCLVGTTSRAVCTGGHLCVHVMGLDGLETHAGLHVHIHPNVHLGLSANVHPWICPQE